MLGRGCVYNHFWFFMASLVFCELLTHTYLSVIFFICTKGLGPVAAGMCKPCSCQSRLAPMMGGQTLHAPARYPGLFMPKGYAATCLVASRSASHMSPSVLMLMGLVFEVRVA